MSLSALLSSESIDGTIVLKLMQLEVDQRQADVPSELHSIQPERYVCGPLSFRETPQTQH